MKSRNVKKVIINVSVFIRLMLIELNNIPFEWDTLIGEKVLLYLFLLILEKVVLMVSDQATLALCS